MSTDAGLSAATATAAPASAALRGAGVLVELLVLAHRNNDRELSTCAASSLEPTP